MAKIKLEPPSAGEKDSAAEPKVTTALKEVESWLNGKNIETTDNLKAGGIAEASLSTALVEKLTTRLGFVVKTETVSFTAESEKHYVTTKAGLTCTLPAPTVNRIVSVWAGGGFATKITASSGKIYGDFVEGATTIELLSQQHVIVIADATNWEIIAGTPKSEQKYEVKTYTKAEFEAGLEVSATRDALVAGKAGAPESVTIGGVSAPNPASIQVLVPAGQKLKGTAAASVEFWVLLR